MRHRTTQIIYSYWNEARQGRLAPRRFDIEPARIAGVLAETTILEQVDNETYRFRLAGTRITEQFATFDHIGCIEGHVVRSFLGGFAIELQATQYKRDKLAGQIAWLMNRHELGENADARRHERIAIANSKQATLKLDEGVSIPVDIIDFSMSGASIATTARPPIGQHVQIGKLKGRVVRHHDEGFGVEFVSVQPQETVTDELV